MLRTLFSLVIGVALIVWAEDAGKYLVILLGAGFFFPALISIIGYFTHRNRELPMPVSFPFFGLGSLIFGFWLMVNPLFFVAVLMYILGAILVLSGISLIVKLIAYRRLMSVALGFYFLPTILILVGLIVLWNPFTVASIPFILLGISCLFYAVSNGINDFKFRRQEAKIIEETVAAEGEAAEETASQKNNDSEDIETVEAEEVE